MSNHFKLEPNERLLIAGFKGDVAALRAKHELEALSGVDVQLDHIDFLPRADHAQDVQTPLSGDFSGLASSVCDTELGHDDAILLGSSTDVSGLTDSSNHVARDIVLAVIINEDQMVQAKQILNRHHAYF